MLHPDFSVEVDSVSEEWHPGTYSSKGVVVVEESLSEVEEVAPFEHGSVVLKR